MIKKFLLSLMFLFFNAYANDFKNYLGLSLSQIKTIDPELKQVLNDAWYSNKFFKASSFFKSPATFKIDKIKKDIEVVKSRILLLDEGIVYLNNQLVELKKKNSTSYSTNNPGLDILYTVLTLPITMVEYSKEEKAENNLKNKIKNMENAKDSLEKVLTNLQEIISDL